MHVSDHKIAQMGKNVVDALKSIRIELTRIRELLEQQTVEFDRETTIVINSDLHDEDLTRMVAEMVNRAVSERTKVADGQTGRSTTDQAEDQA